MRWLSLRKRIVSIQEFRPNELDGLVEISSELWYNIIYVNELNVNVYNRGSWTLWEFPDRELFGWEHVLHNTYEKEYPFRTVIKYYISPKFLEEPYKQIYWEK